LKRPEAEGGQYLRGDSRNADSLGGERRHFPRARTWPSRWSSATTKPRGRLLRTQSRQRKNLLLCC